MAQEAGPGIASRGQAGEDDRPQVGVLAGQDAQPQVPAIHQCSPAPAHQAALPEQHAWGQVAQHLLKQLDGQMVRAWTSCGSWCRAGTRVSRPQEVEVPMFTPPGPVAAAACISSSVPHQWAFTLPHLYSFYYVEVCSFYSCFLESFNHKLMLNFEKVFSASIEIIIMVFNFQFVNVVYHID